MKVVDSSVGLKLVLKDEDSLKALELFATEHLIAPDIYALERHLIAAISTSETIEWTFSKERVIGNPNTKSAKKIEEQKQKRLASQKRGKKEQRQGRRDAKGE